MLIFVFINLGDGKRVPQVDKLRKHLLREGHLDKTELVEII
jgi:hypothetical protein